MSAPRLSEDWKSALMDLEDKWDSYVAKPITLVAIETVGQFATVPCASGGVQLEIHRDGYDIEIEVGPDGRISGVLVSHEDTARKP